MLRRSLLLALPVLALETLPPLAAAAVDPSALIDHLGREALRILAPGVPAAQRRAGFRRLFRENFDVERIARFVLGPYWRAATPAQREQFVQLLEDYVAAVYAAKLSTYSGGTLSIVGSRPEPGGALVITDAKKPDGGPPMRIQWRLDQQDGGYRIGDVIVDGISMATTERAEFASVIQRSGGQIPALIAMLRERVASAPGFGQ